jgi:type II secretory ATPase GspE/PulE/Tfp pilus assembly ATPase PilB-like protein
MPRWRGLNVQEKHVLTIEDPIERFLDGVTQMQSRADHRVTLATGLHILRRQAPDVLDGDRNSRREHRRSRGGCGGGLFGDFVVIASDGLGAVQKLTEMGVPPSLLAERLVGVWLNGWCKKFVRTVGKSTPCPFA